MKKLFVILLLLSSIVLVSCEKDGPSSTLPNNNPNTVPPIINTDSIYKPTDSLDLITGTSKGHGYVDLGLSVKWATMNLGAESIEDYGDYYAWGEVRPKNKYDLNSYKWVSNNQEGYIKYNDVDNKTILELSDDAANVNWGGAWRVPSVEEQKELLSKCMWKWTKRNVVSGYLVTANNGNSIFLPAGGMRIGSNMHQVGETGYYWNRSRDDKYHIYAHYNSFGVDGYDINDSYIRYFGHLIRPVLP